jgi:hypothetical protein
MYNGLRIGHEIPACSKTSILRQHQASSAFMAAGCTFGSMLEGEANNIVGNAEIHFARTGHLADQLLRQQYPYSPVGVARVPRTLHECILVEGRELET